MTATLLTRQDVLSVFLSGQRVDAETSQLSIKSAGLFHIYNNII